MNLTQMLITRKNVNEISAKFGLSEEQAIEAMTALIPAFSEGLKRQTSTAQGAAGLIEALSSGQHQIYVDDPRTAVSADGIKDGNAILGHLFGNKDVSRAVAGQAAAFTGIGASIFKSLLPVIANMVMGSLFKGSTGGRGSGGGLLGKIIGGLAGGLLGGAGGQAAPRRAPSPSGRQLPGSLEDLLGQVLGGGRQQQRSPMPRSRAPSRRQQRRQNPGGLGGLLEEILGGGSRNQPRQRQDPRAQTPRRRRQPRYEMPPPRRKQRGGRQNGGLGEIFGDMLEAGGRTNRDYRRQTGSAFDEFLGN